MIILRTVRKEPCPICNAEIAIPVMWTSTERDDPKPETIYTCGCHLKATSGGKEPSPRC